MNKNSNSNSNSGSNKKLLTLGFTTLALLLIPRRSSRQDASINYQQNNDLFAEDQKASAKTNIE